MNFTPPPIIPQTAEQARQRDHLHGIATASRETDGQRAGRLERAIREHRDTVDQASDPIPDINTALWAHLDA